MRQEHLRWVHGMGKISRLMIGDEVVFSGFAENESAVLNICAIFNSMLPMEHDETPEKRMAKEDVRHNLTRGKPGWRKGS